MGADEYVIWLWAPTRVDNITHQTISQYYPGDQIVDWVGMSGYQRSATSQATFDVTFGKRWACYGLDGEADLPR